MKSLWRYGAIGLIFTYSTLFSQSYVPLNPKNVPARGYILVEAETGTMIAKHNHETRLDPASITKLMTAYVVYKEIASETISLDDRVSISAKARNMGGSRMFLELGSHVSIDNLLHGLVIQSGNDAAVALAEAVSGSESEFVKLMNQYAIKLKMDQSHFKNSTGLTDEGHYTTALDITKLSKAIINEFPEHYKLYKQRTFTWNGIKQENRNGLLRSDPSVDGLKTGHTDAAGYCLAASAKRGNMRLISVVLGSHSKRGRNDASKQILDFGYSHYQLKTLYNAGDKISTKPVSMGKVKTLDIAVDKDVRLPVIKGDEKNISAKLVLDSILVAPISQGQKVGNIVVSNAGNSVTIPAIAMTAVEEVGFFKRLWLNFIQMVASWFS